MSARVLPTQCTPSRLYRWPRPLSPSWSCSESPRPPQRRRRHGWLSQGMRVDSSFLPFHACGSLEKQAKPQCRRKLESIVAQAPCMLKRSRRNGRTSTGWKAGSSMGILPMAHGLEARATSEKPNGTTGAGMGILPIAHRLEARATSEKPSGTTGGGMGILPMIPRAGSPCHLGKTKRYYRRWHGHPAHDPTGWKPVPPQENQAVLQEVAWASCP